MKIKFGRPEIFAIFDVTKQKNYVSTNNTRISL